MLCLPLLGKHEQLFHMASAEDMHTELRTLECPVAQKAERKEPHCHRVQFGGPIYTAKQLSMK